MAEDMVVEKDQGGFLGQPFLWGERLSGYLLLLGIVSGAVVIIGIIVWGLIRQVPESPTLRVGSLRLQAPPAEHTTSHWGTVISESLGSWQTQRVSLRGAEDIGGRDPSFTVLLGQVTDTRGGLSLAQLGPHLADTWFGRDTWLSTMSRTMPSGLASWSPLVKSPLAVVGQPVWKSEGPRNVAGVNQRWALYVVILGEKPYVIGLGADSAAWAGCTDPELDTTIQQCGVSRLLRGLERSPIVGP